MSRIPVIAKTKVYQHFVIIFIKKIIHYKHNGCADAAIKFAYKRCTIVFPVSAKS